MSGRAVGHYVMVWDGCRFDTYTDPRTGVTEPVSIGRVLREMRGTRGVRIERVDGTVVLRNAGTAGVRLISDRPTVEAWLRRQGARWYARMGWTRERLARLGMGFTTEDLDAAFGAAPTPCADGRHRPDDDPEPGDRCKDCGRELTWRGPGPYDFDLSD